ncbi:MAG: SAM-dependent methyltransferase [Candidatus Thorarchaeota archaeon]|nr:SAM-dependent methyltransferase [Candidatus Thorarchaeota archaeon]
MVDWLLILGIEICIIIFVIWIAWSGVVGAPWVPTPKKRVRSMLEFAEVSSDDILYDLGSGDGRIVVMAGKEFGATSIGIELDPLRLLWSRLSIRRHNLRKKVRVIRANFFKVSLEGATVVTLYQGYEINKKIRDKLASELKPGSRVVSYRFILDGWTPTKTKEEESIYLYVI